MGKEDASQLVSNTKKRLKRMVVKDTKAEETRKSLLTETVKSQDAKEWATNVNDWMDSFEPVSLVYVLFAQLLYVIPMSILTITPLHYISLIYFIMLPTIMSVQGELWKEGIGRYIRLQDRDMLDTIIRTCLLLGSSLAVVFLTKTLEQTYNWCIMILVLLVLVIQPLGETVIYWCIKGLNDWMDSSESEYERRYTNVKYKTHYYFFPILTLILSILFGILGISCINAVWSDSGGRSVTSAVTNI